MIKDSLKTITISLIVLSLISVVYAWTEPSSNPPAGNVSAPVNVSGTGQIKSGSLQVNGFRNLSTTILDGNVGIGTTTGPGYKLDVVGDIRAQNAWLRTTGNTGWYSDSYGGGWYMSDPTWIRSYGGKNVYSDSTIRADGGFQVDGQQVIDGDAGWHRTYGNTGWYNGTYGGGWFMQDPTWIRAYNNKNVYTPGEIQAGTIRGNSSVCIGGNCRSSWPAGITAVTRYSAQYQWWGSGTTNLGNHTFCALAEVNRWALDYDSRAEGVCNVYPSGSSWYLYIYANGKIGIKCTASCIN